MAILDIAGVAALGAPVLCFDTCTLLDLMRDPTRESIRAHERQAGIDLLAAMETGPRLTVLMAAQVEHEVNENIHAIEKETTEALDKFRRQISRIEAVAAVYGSAGNANLTHLGDHVTRARGIVDRWLKASALVQQKATIASAAFARVNDARTPAKKGKDSMKDCVVIETYLDAVTDLRAQSLQSRVVFVSSNTKDYAGENSANLKSDLAADFAKLNMDYAPNLAAAKHLLGL